MPNGNKKGQPLKYRNISVDADLVEKINKVADNLKKTMGFRPTISQTIRFLVKESSND
jgi:hypothetical protein